MLLLSSVLLPWLEQHDVVTMLPYLLFRLSDNSTLTLFETLHRSNQVDTDTFTAVDFGDPDALASSL